MDLLQRRGGLDLYGLCLEPGGRWRDAAALPEDAPPGRYRVSKDVNGIGTNLKQTVSFEFHVAEK